MRHIHLTLITGLVLATSPMSFAGTISLYAGDATRKSHDIESYDEIVVQPAQYGGASITLDNPVLGGTLLEADALYVHYTHTPWFEPDPYVSLAEGEATGSPYWTFEFTPAYPGETPSTNAPYVATMEVRESGESWVGKSGFPVGTGSTFVGCGALSWDHGGSWSTRSSNWTTPDTVLLEFYFSWDSTRSKWLGKAQLVGGFFAFFFSELAANVGTANFTTSTHFYQQFHITKVWDPVAVAYTNFDTPW